MAVSAISGLGGLSASSMNPISSVRRREMVPDAYTLDNQSDVSDAFRQSLAANGVEGIMAPTPVSYPTAHMQEHQFDRAASATQVNRYYNAIASGFGDATTSYNAAGKGSSYGAVGQSIDYAV